MMAKVLTALLGIAAVLAFLFFAAFFLIGIMVLAETRKDMEE